MVLSGMGNMDMMNDNIATMSDFVPLNEEELAATDKAREIIRRVKQIPCTSCEYCMENCPKDIHIPKIFTAYNEVMAAKVTRGQAKKNLPTVGGSATDCIGCGTCERVCPQGIQIRDLLKKIAKDLKL